MKTCTKCKAVKPFEEFAKNRTNKDGRQKQCRTCVQKYNQLYYEKNAEIIKNAVGEARRRNPEKDKERKRIYHELNADKIRAKVKRWKQDNPEKVKKNASKYNKKHKKELALIASARRAKIRNNGVFLITPKEIQKLYSSACFYCNSTNQVEGDHVIPVSKGGRHSIGNLVPACKRCNIDKSNKFLMAWKIERKNNGENKS